MFEWKKLGLVFNLKNIENKEWMKEQAQNPYPVDMGNFIRVFFNSRAERDSEGKSRSLAAFVDLDKDDLTKILGIADEPILDHGKIGDFDEFGIMAGSIAQINQKYYLYYVGWTRLYSVPYNWSIGLAISSDGGKRFERFGRGPIIASTHQEPYLQAGCSSLLEIDGRYHLWYTSGIKWINTDSKPESVYQIMHAISTDGIHWERDGKPIIKNVVKDEAQASPSVIYINDRWHMFFCYRHSVDFRNKERGYRLGYAWSDDLIHWNREDHKIGLTVSESGWDSEMVCYPSVTRINDQIYLFYCGNDFGKYGFGIAKLIYK
jgi:predicted GH43/DUF377 family glycosyl hydrolase